MITWNHRVYFYPAEYCKLVFMDSSWTRIGSINASHTPDGEDDEAVINEKPPTQLATLHCRKGCILMLSHETGRLGLAQPVAQKVCVRERRLLALVHDVGRLGLAQATVQKVRVRERRLLELCHIALDVAGCYALFHACAIDV